jgi:hypothetical protein
LVVRAAARLEGVQKGRSLDGKSGRRTSVFKWVEGDKVTPVVPTDHPEDVVGEVVMITANGSVMVQFPLAGAEMYPPDELAPAPVEKGE